MRKKFLFALAPLFFLACNFLIPTSQLDETPHPASPEPATVQPTLSVPEVDSPSSPFVIVRINTEDGDLLTQLAAEVKKAQELNLTPFIEFDATWCPPCQVIDESINAEDPLTLKAFEGIYLIRADVDKWGWGNDDLFVVEAIPVYFHLGEDGKPTGASVNGGAWKEDIPENFAPVLDEFFHAP